MGKKKILGINRNAVQFNWYKIMRTALALSGTIQIYCRTNRITKIMGTVVNKEPSSEEVMKQLIKRIV